MSSELDRIARAFHETYELLAPEFGYSTREATRVAWEDVPVNNKALMRATIGALLGEEIIRPGAKIESGTN
jgi:hypothetical protein